MALQPGTRIGPYEIGDALGAGGMGEVYRATDTNLKRAVAIKVLPESFAADAERVARFQREAEVLARLNQPNIALIHGLEKTDGVTALVMELVEGPTLADRIEKGPIPVEEALILARQIVEALAAAHDQRIVHRDLKPANIKVRPDGTVKVLDFGLAKSIDSAQVSGLKTQGDLTNSPTLTSPAMTQMGLILGTAAYMSPEQAKGQAVDQRVDIWAFGAVLFEVLSGRRAFDGDDMTDVLGAVVRLEPNWEALPAVVPPRIRQVIRACLQKNVKVRLAHIRDAGLALDGAFEAPAIATTAGAPQQRPRWRGLVPVAGAAIAGGAIVAIALWPAAPEPGPVTRFELTAPDQFRNLGRPVIAVSPDGRRIAYNTRTGLHVQSLSEGDARLLPGTAQALTNPFFSPDGQSVGYWQAGELKRLSLTGGAPVRIVEAENPFGVTWASDNHIYFAQPQGIYRVAADGGVPEIMVRGAEGEQMDGPQLLPDGDALLFSVTTTAAAAAASRWDNAQIVVLSLRSGERKVLIKGGSDARFVPTGHLVYALNDGLFAIRFDAARLEVSGGTMSVVQGIQRAVGQTSTANYAVADDGTLFHVVRDMASATRALHWVDRQGATEPVPTIPPSDFDSPRLSPDGAHLVVVAQGNVRVYDLRTGRESRITNDGLSLNYAGWSHDGTMVAYSSFRGGPSENVWIQSADGTGNPTEVPRLDGGGVHFDDWSPLGQALTVHRHLGGQVDAFVVPVSGGKPGNPQPFLTSQASESNAVFSPDGRYVAHVSNEAEHNEVYIRPFPGPGSRTPVSVGGGVEPAWARNGELFYRRLRDGRMMVASVRTSPTLTVGPPLELFAAVSPSLLGISPRARYAVSANGQRFILRSDLLQTGSGAPPLPTVRVVMNWTEELRRLVPTD